MYLSILDLIAVMIALGLSIVVILLVARSNRELIVINRRLRTQIRRQVDQCNNYHSPRPF